MIETPLLSVTGLHKSFGGRPSLARLLRGKPARRLTALDDVSLTLGRNEVLGIVGESGSGKSTIARCITRLERPDQGEITFGGQDVWQARGAVLLVGVTGLYMVAKLDLWGRFRSLDFWWMHAMVCVWTLFALLLFIGEPLVLHRRFPGWAARKPELAFRWLHRAHLVLLTLALVTVFGAVAGSHGWSIF